MRKLAGVAGIAAIVWLLVACSHTRGGPGLSENETAVPALPEGSPASTLSGLNPRLAGPGLSENPAQADKGSIVYWQICMACHGDRGQGLTDEWRDAWGEDKNCWSSKCHAANHPPQGFQLPKTVPAILGTATMGRFSDARELSTYIAERMPWWSPGSLSPEQSLAVTAYLLRERKAVPPGTDLSEANLSAFRPLREVRNRAYEKVVVLGAVVLLSGAALGAVLRRRLGG